MPPDPVPGTASVPVSPIAKLPSATYAPEAERLLLAALLTDPAAWSEVSARVSEVDFHRREHALIFRAVGALVESGSRPDPYLVAEWLVRYGPREGAPGPADLQSIAIEAPEPGNAPAYADLVRDRAVLRELYNASLSIRRAASGDAKRATADVLDEAEQAILAVGNRRGAAGGVVRASAAVDVFMERLEARVRGEALPAGVATGFAALDAYLQGLAPGDLVVLAGRPSMGKTALALGFTLEVAVRAREPVVFFSLEMSAEQVLSRLASMLAQVPHSAIRAGALDVETLERVRAAAAQIRHAPLHIDDTPALSPVEIRSRARRIATERPLGLVVVDYLQLLRSASPSRESNRVAEVSAISQSLKALARELGTPVLALSQLSRAVESRADRRPQLADLRDSGAIEQDADVVMMLFRPAAYDPGSTDPCAELILAKQRNGPTGVVHLVFHGEIASFYGR